MRGVVPLRLGPRPKGVRREQDGPVPAGPETGGEDGPNAALDLIGVYYRAILSEDASCSLSFTILWARPLFQTAQARP